MQETKESVHWKLLLATLQWKHIFIFSGDFGHGDHALAAYEVAARPVDTGDRLERVTADDTLDASKSMSVSHPVYSNMFHHLICFLKQLPRVILLFDPEGSD